MTITSRLVCAAVILQIIATPAAAQENDPRPAAGIQDNSFLIEEAYNQEAGVVQHISNLRRQGHDWVFAFTQEWPVRGQTHQLSYTVPYSWLREDGNHAQGFGDVFLNYRYQLSMETASRPAIAPRVSLILPTGDPDKDLGAGSLGYQFNLPISKIVTDRMTLHGNAGVTSYADVKGRQPTSYHLGGSVIYAVTRNFNLMLEGLGEWNKTVGPINEIERERSLILSPGMRFGLNYEGGTQVVLGVAAPVRFAENDRDYGVFLYLSVEHPFSVAKKE